MATSSWLVDRLDLGAYVNVNVNVNDTFSTTVLDLAKSTDDSTQRHVGSSHLDLT